MIETKDFISFLITGYSHFILFLENEVQMNTIDKKEITMIYEIAIGAYIDSISN